MRKVRAVMREGDGVRPGGLVRAAPCALGTHEAERIPVRAGARWPDRWRCTTCGTTGPDIHDLREEFTG